MIMYFYVHIILTDTIIEEKRSMDSQSVLTSYKTTEQDFNSTKGS